MRIEMDEVEETLEPEPEIPEISGFLDRLQTTE
jgi:hypothetical protein